MRSQSAAGNPINRYCNPLIERLFVSPLAGEGPEGVVHSLPSGISAMVIHGVISGARTMTLTELKDTRTGSCLTPTDSACIMVETCPICNCEMRGRIKNSTSVRGVSGRSCSQGVRQTSAKMINRVQVKTREPFRRTTRFVEIAHQTLDAEPQPQPTVSRHPHPIAEGWRKGVKSVTCAGTPHSAEGRAFDGEVQLSVFQLRDFDYDRALDRGHYVMTGGLMSWTDNHVFHSKTFS